MQISNQFNNMDYQYKPDISSVKKEQQDPIKLEQKSSIDDSNVEKPNQKPLQELSNQELAALYFNVQSTKLTQDIVDIYTKNNQDTDYTQNSTSLSLKDAHELQK